MKSGKDRIKRKQKTGPLFRSQTSNALHAVADAIPSRKKRVEGNPSTRFGQIILDDFFTVRSRLLN
jgi:hypothetical protein